MLLDKKLTRNSDNGARNSIMKREIKKKHQENGVNSNYLTHTGINRGLSQQIVGYC